MRRVVGAALCAVALVSGPSILSAEEGPDTVPALASERNPSTGPESATPAIGYVEGRGVVFRTPDGLFEASLGFNLQVRFTDLELDAAAGGLRADEFRVRRFRLFLSGFFFDPRLTWRFQAAFESTAANRTLDDAWLQWRFGDAVQARFGQYKTPFAREELYNDGVLQFPERAIAVDAFKPSRDIGVMAAGSLATGLVDYQAGVFGGEGQTTLSATNHLMPVVRLVANPLGSLGGGEADLRDHEAPALSFGASGFANTLRKVTNTSFDALMLNYAGPAGWLGRNASLFETGEDVAIKSWSFDAQFQWHGLSVQAEGFFGQAVGQTSNVHLYAYGWYGQAGYFLLKGRVDVAARYAFVDYNRSADADGVSTVSADASYYFRRNSLKIVVDYTRTHRQRPGLAPANDQAFLVQVQLMP